MPVLTTEYKGFKALGINIYPYRATILYGRGCNIIEFFHEEYDLNLLHYPEDNELSEFLSSPQRFGSAILFPPNKISSGCFTRDGITYDFTGNGLPCSHGILKELPFECIECTENPGQINVKLRYNSTASKYDKAFSWKFICTFEFTLDNSGLTQQITFDNIGDTKIPLGVGFHTAFRIPENDSHSPEDYGIYVSCRGQWELNENGCPTGRISETTLDFTSGSLNPSAHVLAHHLAAADKASGSDFHGAVIINHKTGHKLFYETDPVFKDWMVWNNKASDNYVCIEPMSWIINAPDTPVPDSESGFTYLYPSEKWTAKNRMYVK